MSYGRARDFRRGIWIGGRDRHGVDRVKQMKGDGMIHHLVLVKFRADVTQADKQAIWDALEALGDIVDGLVSAAFGSNISPEGFSQGYNDGFVMVFRDAEARDTYLEHPAHKAAGGQLVAALEGGVDGLLVVDI
ncbi:MAG: Dabb family protein [Marinosulfonomonas sp.]